MEEETEDSNRNYRSRRRQLSRLKWKHSEERWPEDGNVETDVKISSCCRSHQTFKHGVTMWFDVYMEMEMEMRWISHAKLQEHPQPNSEKTRRCNVKHQGWTQTAGNMHNGYQAPLSRELVVFHSSMASNLVVVEYFQS